LCFIQFETLFNVFSNNLLSCIFLGEKIVDNRIPLLSLSDDIFVEFICLSVEFGPIISDPLIDLICEPSIKCISYVILCLLIDKICFQTCLNILYLTHN